MTSPKFEEENFDIAKYNKYHNPDRAEEVQNIIEKMPTKFGLWISGIVIFIFLLLLIFGWIIRYPDMVTGKVTINTPVSPIKLVANAPGKIKLLTDSSQSFVNEEEVIAYVENATSFDTLQMIKKLLKEYNPNEVYNTSILAILPSKSALGELTAKYYNFLNNLHQVSNFVNDKLYDKQIASLHQLRIHQIKEIENSSERININKSNVAFSEKFLKRDSTLYADKVAAEAELDRTKIQHLNSKSAFSNARSSQIDAEKQAQQTLSRISEIDVQKGERKKELEIALLASYNELMDNITNWEQKYLFKAPFRGFVQFLKFWTDGQYVQTQEPVFTIIPDAGAPYGQVMLPAFGAGKVEVGQEVIIKLDDFPYNEYGSITGIVNSISLTTNTEKAGDGSMEAYLLTVKFPKGLLTNYGKQVVFRYESKGSAEIVTKDRRLVERLFDNLKYALNK